MKISICVGERVCGNMAQEVCGCYEDVLDFWFVHPEKTIVEKTRFWFRGGPDVDMLIKKKVGHLVVKARSGLLSQWADLTHGIKAGLAYIILLDQCSRNIYRGTSNMFSHDTHALTVATAIIKRYQHTQLPWYQRLFLYMPLQHSERMDMQELGLDLYKRYAEDLEGTEVEKCAKISLEKMLEHYVVIKQYGRFPKRNAILQRQSTPQEKKALENWPFMWSLSKEKYNKQLAEAKSSNDS